MENGEIKFKGKRIDNEEWVYGHYYEYNGKSIICNENHTDGADTYNNFEVIPETVGQFIGLKDKNSQDIYKGDVLNSNYFKNSQVVFWRSGWHLRVGKDTYYSFNTSMHSFEIIGNIHTNPELL